MLIFTIVVFIIVGCFMLNSYYKKNLYKYAIGIAFVLGLNVYSLVILLGKYYAT